MFTNNRIVISLMIACAMVALALAATMDALAAAPRRVADTFTATTANMTPAGLSLRMQILEWQEAPARMEVVAALAAGGDTAAPLAKLPTVGYIWPAASPVGYSVKYAYREPTAGGGERITLVTDKRLGSYDYKKWSVPSPAKELSYSVVVLDVSASGTGTGNLSLGAAVMLDEAAGTVALMGPAGASLLTNVKRETTAH
ncbi:MAG TPA: hypothetical protein VM692_03280 [Gammaproteobacteria bacterium]|nr:hypothetical protein [Gammaproteobacteria bacterium]